MSRRSYHQYCALAAALDVLGERWTLLILRGLLYGPKRFKDLHADLPGIGTGLLAERLKQLQADGVIEQTTLPPPAGTAAYQLTADGHALRGILVGLARWGLSRVPPADGDIPLPPPESLILPMEARFDPDAAGDADGVYALRVDATVFRIEIRDRGIDIRIGPADAPLATASTDTATLLALNDGSLTLETALLEQHLTLGGDVESALRLAETFGLTRPAPARG